MKIGNKEYPKFEEQLEDQAKELHYLRWIWATADFGPADGDVRDYLNERYKKETGKKVPEGWTEE